MSRPRDIDSDPDDDKERKKAKLSEEEKAEGVSKEGNALSSSTPSDSTGTGDESMSGSKEGKALASSTSPSDSTGTGEESMSGSKESMSGSKEGKALASSTPPSDSTGTGEESMSGSKEGKALALASSTPPSDSTGTGEESMSGDTDYSSDLGANHGGIFLFELVISRDEIGSPLLFLSYDVASRYFPPLAIPGRISKAKLKISDSQNHDWDGILFCSPAHHTFAIGGIWWENFVANHNLKATDVICFYSPFPYSNDYHYLIDYVRREELPDDLSDDNGNKILAKSTLGIFLFHLQLTPIDITCGSLIIPEKKLVHFPIINITDEPVKMKWLHFTDAQDNESLALLFLLYNDMDGYKIIGGLDTYLKKYNLKEGDMIRFYMPCEPKYENHFVIDHVKREEVADSAKEDGSGNSSSSGGDDKQGDDSGGLSQGDSNSSYKGGGDDKQGDDRGGPSQGDSSSSYMGGGDDKQGDDRGGPSQGDSSSSYKGGGDDKQGDDCGGPSQGDSSSSYKGKETAVGHENPAPGQGPHTHE